MEASARVPKHRTCGTMDEHRRLLRTDPRYRANRLKLEEFTQTYTKRTAGQGLRSGIVIIPVVVHIVSNTAVQNIAAPQINSQIAILNRDYRKLNADIGSVPAAFSPLAADARIEFRLAQRDPSCNPTSGITRTSTAVATFHQATNDIKSAATGGHDAWPRDRYLNIWVAPQIVNGAGADLLGYAQFPGGPAATDGVVIVHSGFGDTGTAAAPYNLGRTATHEIGHWLNLLHIWGDDDADAAPQCGGSDQVADTPNQAIEHFGCPPFPTLSCSNGPNGDMFMNYMDYTDDRCMFMFTAGQSTRMDASLYGSRSAIVGSSGHLPPAAPPGPDLWSEDRADDTGAEPDPASGGMWESDDIWVRRQNDGLTQQEHQNPEFRTAGGSPNFVYVRVRNRGCNPAAAGATVNLYWAKASTALAWPRPWDGSITVPALMGNPIGTKPTGAVAAAGFTILEFPWTPPNPADYASFGADKSHFCLLSRIETTATAPFGMTTPEGSDLNANVRNNNNIVWKNITVVDDVPGTGRIGYVTVGGLAETHEAKLVFTLPRERIKAKSHASVLDWGSVYVDLGKLFDKWRQSGGLSDGIAHAAGTEVRIQQSGAWLRGLQLEPGDLFTISLRFESAQKTEGNAIYFIDLTQYAIEGANERIIGGQEFVLKTLARNLRKFSRDDVLTFNGAEWAMSPTPERVATPL